VRSSRRLELIERNRVLLAAKLFPWSLLWLNGFYFSMRLAAGFWAALRNRGEVGRYPGVHGKLQAALSMVKGDLEALALLPRILRKRRQVDGFRKLAPREVRNLILKYRIPLKQLTEQSV
jgi:hypothetical protein